MNSRTLLENNELTIITNYPVGIIYNQTNSTNLINTTQQQHYETNSLFTSHSTDVINPQYALEAHRIDLVNYFRYMSAMLRNNDYLNFASDRLRNDDYIRIISTTFHN
jgi:hypothetical protein